MSDALLDAPAVTETDDNDEWLIALVVVLLLLGANAARPLTMSQRARARRLLRNGFEGNSLLWAQRLIDGDIAPDAWRAGVEDMIANYARQMAVAGAGTMPSAGVRQFAEAQVGAQMPFLARFAGLVGTLTLAQIASRTRLYGGVAWGAHWMAQEDSARQPGTIVHYRARDDKGTCGPCHQAQARGPYIAGSNHPVPGSVCRGGGLCRCELEFEVNPTEYARLTGRVA